MDDELLTLLKEREEAVRERVEELRAELAALNERIEGAEDELSHLVITRRTLDVLRAELDAEEGAFDPVRAAQPDPDDPSDPAPPVVNTATGEVPAEGDWPVLAFLAGANGPLRAKELCEAVEETVDHRHIETLRMRLKRMVRRGWLDEPDRGLFTLADGVRTPVQS
ncbi:hypothetical protein [Streptomyces sp. YGL11-2]|uniref:hypothetical protein n=1 Tax=Streptomyces sp. YGL11-2 TaxID=3414028 RepID=UPI003CFA1D08